MFCSGSAGLWEKLVCPVMTSAAQPEDASAPSISEGLLDGLEVEAVPAPPG